jgi:peptidoglycan/xylan/chitin deacetylase (PgdA/CDA1 family)
MGPRVRGAVRTLVNPVGSRMLGSVHRFASPDGVALTLDDGPDPVETPRILTLLASESVSATFFLLAERAVRHPELVQGIVAGGHEVALHGWDHRRVSGMSRSAASAYLVGAREALEDVADTPVTLFRPPYGSQSVASFRGARDANLNVVVWNADAQDWVDRSAGDVARDAVEASEAGTILLLHERIEPDPLRGAPTTTFDRVEMLAATVAGLRHVGLEPQSLRDLAGGSPHQRTVWFRP